MSETKRGLVIKPISKEGIGRLAKRARVLRQKLQEQIDGHVTPHLHCSGCGFPIEPDEDLCPECRFPRAGVGEDE